MNLVTQNKSLFVLDDDIMFHRILTLANKKSFFDISHHYEVRPLLTYLWNNRVDTVNLPDVIFVDLTIPLYDGWSFLNVYQKIRHHLAKDITIYVLSASISQVDIDRVANYSFVKQYIIKPISLDKFREISGYKNNPLPQQYHLRGLAN